MSDQRFIIETGMGTDQYGMDYTKAAARAINDAIHRSAIPMYQALDIDPSDMRVQVTIGVQDPQQVDCTALVAHLPRGTATVTATLGGLNVENPETGNTIVIATAAVEAFLPGLADQWQIKP